MIEGKVEVQSIDENKILNKTFLEAGKQLTYRNNQLIENGSFESSNVIGWKDGRILFSNADFNTVIVKLERWYGVEFDYPHVLPKWNLDASFENASLEQVMDVIAHSEKIEYQLFENRVKLWKD